jgi:4-hydroxybenzoate polyprenyltransferase
MPEVHTLPYHPDLLRYLREQRQRGRRLILASGADERLARAIAEELGIFDQVLASDGYTNLTGEVKRDRLVSCFGKRGFDYVGNNRRDLAVWRCARRALLIGPSTGFENAVAEVAPLEQVFPKESARAGLYLQELRWHHWSKNVLVLVPLLAQLRLHDLRMLLPASLAVCGFCLAASSIYLLNDLLDLPDDRRHSWKKERPLASGRIPVGDAVALLPLLWLAAFAVATALPAAYLGALCAYLVLMLAYNFRLKEIRIVDALVLGCGYTLRILAGALALHMGVSPWLLGSSVLFFFSLALLKRYAELVMMEARGELHERARAYRIADATALATVGPTVAALAILVLALYPVADSAIHQARWWVWCIDALLLFWSQRMWLMGARGRIRDDPVMFALKDKMSVAVGIIVLLLMIAA